MQSPPFPVTSSLLGPNSLLNTMFSNTLSFRVIYRTQRAIKLGCKVGLIKYMNCMSLCTDRSSGFLMQSIKTVDEESVSGKTKYQ